MWAAHYLLKQFGLIEGKPVFCHQNYDLLSDKYKGLQMILVCDLRLVFVNDSFFIWKKTSSTQDYNQFTGILILGQNFFYYM